MRFTPLFKCFCKAIFGMYSVGEPVELVDIYDVPELNNDMIDSVNCTREQINNFNRLLDIDGANFNERIRKLKESPDNREGVLDWIFVFIYIRESNLSSDSKFVCIWLDKIIEDETFFHPSNHKYLKKLCRQMYRFIFDDTTEELPGYGHVYCREYDLELVAKLKHIMYKFPYVERETAEAETRFQDLYLFVEEVVEKRYEDVFTKNFHLDKIFKSVIFDLFHGFIQLDNIPHTLHIDIKYYMNTSKIESRFCQTIVRDHVAKLFYDNRDELGDFQWMIDMDFNYRELFSIFNNLFLHILIIHDWDVPLFNKVITNFVNCLFSVDMETYDIVESEFKNMFVEVFHLFRSKIGAKLFYQTLFNAVYNEHNTNLVALDYIKIMCKSFSDRCRRYYESMTIKVFDYDDKIDISDLEELMSNLKDYHSLLQGIKTDILEKSVYDALVKIVGEDVMEKKSLIKIMEEDVSVNKSYFISLSIVNLRCFRKKEAILSLCQMLELPFGDMSKQEEIEEKLEAFKKLGINEYGIVSTLLSSLKEKK